MNTLGTARIGSEIELRAANRGRDVASPANSQKAYLAAASGVEVVSGSQMQMAARVVGNMTTEQSAAINAAWRQYSNSNPIELTRQMEEFGVSAADMSIATGQSHGAVGDMIHRAGRPQGFTGTDYFDPSSGNLTDASTYNTWSYMPASTYVEYVAKEAASKNDPLANWLCAGYPVLSEADWNALNERVKSGKARGVSFGTVSYTAQMVSTGQQQSSAQAQVESIKSHSAEVAVVPQRVLTVSQQALSDALEAWTESGSGSSWIA